MITALDVLNEYTEYVKIIRRKNENSPDIEKAQIIIEALEARTAKKPHYIDGDYGLPLCPICHIAIDKNENEGYCTVCGQAIDWSDEE